MPDNAARDAALLELASEREKFRAAIAASPLPSEVHSRIGVVLAGGGARGAYEVGVLLAFQDAKLPTHIIAATSVGSINAASYAAHGSGLVGNAESLLDSWSHLTPPALGIDWSRFMFMLAGLIAATAGIANALRDWLEGHNFVLHMHNPVITWMALAAAGFAVLWFFDVLSYIGYVAVNMLRGRHWVPDNAKAWKSVLANLTVFSFIGLFLSSTHLHLPSNRIFKFDASMLWVLLLVLPVLLTLGRVLRGPVSKLSRRFIRLPLRSGLFPNYERTNYLRGRIPQEPLRASPITVVFTATDLKTGEATFFCNRSRDALKQEPLAHAGFIDHEVEPTEELLQAVIASSAFTMAYEAVSFQGRLWSDGGIITNQPIRPAVRLGADVLFLVLTDPLRPSDTELASEPIETFIDVGIHALSILVSKNLKTDLKVLDRMNRMCVDYSRELGVRPEQVHLHVGEQHLRYVKAIAVAPAHVLAVNPLEFDGNSSAPMMVAGYRDGMRAVREFADYERQRPAAATRRVVRLSAERPEGNFHVAGN